MALSFLQETTLKFSSMEELWRFQKLAQLRNYHIGTIDCTLRAQLTEEQKRIAIAEMKAVQQDQQKTA